MASAETAEPPAPPRRTARYPKAVVKQARDLYAQGFTPEAIGGKLGIRPKRISIWASGGGWTALSQTGANTARLDSQTKAQSVREELLSQSRDARLKLAAVLMTSIDRLSKRASTNKLPHVATLLDSLMRSADRVFGWSTADRAELGVGGSKVQVSVGLRLSRLPSGKQLAAAIESSVNPPIAPTPGLPALPAQCPPSSTPEPAPVIDVAQVSASQPEVGQEEE